MAKKVLTIEDKEKKRWKKLREAIRNMWQYDHVRKAVIDEAAKQYPAVTHEGGKFFKCLICKQVWPIELATVDHEPELGGFATWDEFFNWTLRCFTGPQRAICKPCHKRKKRPSKGAKRGKSRLPVVQTKAA